MENPSNPWFFFFVRRTRVVVKTVSQWHPICRTTDQKKHANNTQFHIISAAIAELGRPAAVHPSGLGFTEDPRRPFLPKEAADLFPISTAVLRQKIFHRRVQIRSSGTRTAGPHLRRHHHRHKSAAPAAFFNLIFWRPELPICHRGCHVARLEGSAGEGLLVNSAPSYLACKTAAGVVAMDKTVFFSFIFLMDLRFDQASRETPRMIDPVENSLH